MQNSITVSQAAQPTINLLLVNNLLTLLHSNGVISTDDVSKIIDSSIAQISPNNNVLSEEITTALNTLRKQFA